jgi:hypothetical protein
VARHSACAVVAEIGLLRASAGIGEVEAHHRAFSFGYFLAAVVAHQNRLSGHDFLPAWVSKEP